MNSAKIIETLIAHNITLSSVESFTGGLFAAKVINHPGVSAIFKGAIVPYQNELKTSLLNISSDDLTKYGPVSSVVAQAMARNGKRILGSDFCFAFTGNADSDNDKVIAGDVYIALAYGEDEILEHIHIKGDRNKVREEAVSHAFLILARVLENYF